MHGALIKLDAGRMAALGSTGMGIYQLLLAPEGLERAVGVLELLLRRDDGPEIFDKFDSVRHELWSGKPARLSWVVVKWLMSAETALCAAAAKLVQEVHGREVSLAVPPGQPPLSDNQLLFLARKAIGWLFISPTAATSLALSLLDQATAESAADIADLLYDPLVLNYPGSVREELQSALCTLSGAALEALKRTLARHDALLRDIEAAGEIPELHQSERNRRIERQRQDDEFQAARRAAEGRSVLRSIMHVSLLLHGTRSISYADGLVEGSAPRRMDSQLGRVSVEREHPVQLAFDPLGLQAKLTAYRTEQPPK